jgi:hypothetical protein
MALTVAEKEHWKDRIEKRIAKKIDQLYDSDPQLASQLSELPRERAIDSLGLRAKWDELHDLEEQEKEIQKQKEAACEEMHFIITGSRERHGYYRHRVDDAVENAIKKRMDTERDKILAESEVGRTILSLQSESENILDTVWLATSPKQVKELWDQVAAFLGETLSPLQQGAQSIEPME